MIYLDHNATTPLLPEVVEAMLPFLTTHFGNPSSGHALGRAAKEAVARARAQVAALVGASPEEVVFTSGGTEATALALRGTLRPGKKEKLVTTRVEHPATARVVAALEREGHQVVRLSPAVVAAPGLELRATQPGGGALESSRPGTPPARDRAHEAAWGAALEGAQPARDTTRDAEFRAAVQGAQPAQETGRDEEFRAGLQSAQSARDTARDAEFRAALQGAQSARDTARDAEFRAAPQGAQSARGHALDATLGAALEGARWLSVIHAHNETGALVPLAALAARTRAHGVLLHADASQSAGKVELSLARDGFDLLTLAAHKLYGPKGVGALIVRRGVELQSQQLGAGQERGLRAGTENVASIVGFGAACVAAARDLDALAARLRGLQERLERGLINAIPGLRIAAHDSPRLPNTTYALFPGVSGTALLARTPELAASTGSACHDGHEEPPAVLLELGFAPEVALGAVRLTTGRHTTEAEIDSAVTELARSWQFLKG